MRTISELREACARFPGTAETFPFDATTLVFKVGGKMFALTSVTADPVTLSLKCEPARAERLRAEHPGKIVPGYHLNKRHWNTLVLDGSLPSDLVLDLLVHSRELVVGSLPKAEREALLRYAPPDNGNLPQD